ncbi:MAG: Rne/Rng family ribonuclease [Rhodobiaceae bacterium]|nr:Rne/Rng family ribonuclease [Rhodobiaceae bacterium]MCC0014335.1 Rne/Rng family ribonuclease [Rhodobiaceae bacterium]MCC0060567.1 Rne/Rng family ribonuclease [Rhodobiaceae bacterium]
MANKMLIDATHPEETRVVVTRGNRIEEFDFEAASKKQLRGNIYLARVTRVEPSLQAAFVDYGGNRHGFLAFSEIHPDYYQIPFADRQALIDEEAEDDEAEDTDEDNAASPEDADETDAPSADAEASTDEDGDDSGGDNGTAALAAEDDAVSEPASDSDEEENGDDEDESNGNSVTEVTEEDSVESVGSEDALEELPRRAGRRKRNYKIQEVIKRKQVLLVQVVKEERGNKGAALTTYLSLAGRYCVLMPNTARGGGISRKITSSGDRKRLKEVARELEVPEGMGVILRTAGASRTKSEIRRDFEYLLRLWENVRELTLESMAPTLVYEEGNLVKRAIRDLYNKDIDQVLVSGDTAYREAKDFMRMLMPSHAKNVQVYKESEPIYIRNGIEGQLDAMFSAEVTLKSGGYIVINQTEALVAIDVNSGKATREHSIEDTALKTNLEAAAEISRQLRLRDLAGLIVIDFIDMEEKRNNRAVERKLKDCLKSDRARIQVGRISHFGLLEMSRQRIRSGIMEGSFEKCAHCSGSGIVRSTASVALHVLRAIEDELRKRVADLTITTQSGAALYILNQKRDHLFDLEQRYGVRISILGDDTLTSTLMTMERHAPSRTDTRQETRVVTTDDATPVAMDDEEEEDFAPRDGEGGGRRRRRRRRRRGSGDGETAADGIEEIAASDDDDGGSDDDEADDERTADGSSEEREGGGRKRRRRGRRGGRRRRGQQAQPGDEEATTQDAGDAANDNESGEIPGEPDAGEPEDMEAADTEAVSVTEAEEKPKPRRRSRRKSAANEDVSEAAVEPAENGDAVAAEETSQEGVSEEKPKRARRSRAKAKPEDEASESDMPAAAEADSADDGAAAESAFSADADTGVMTAQAEAEPVAEAEDEKPSGPPRRGWWQRALRSDDA